jgi:2-succinyl-6-hydroxy-2,4-cyclohexadiene-1-carboxylate synthase
VGSALEKVKILCLHGFLGLPTDWDFIQSHFMVSPLAGQFEWRSIDYMKVPGLGPQSSFAIWARNFNQKIRAEMGQGPCVLVGYSLGGRLALQALKADPGLYKAAVFISTNPGLQREKDIQDRIMNDQMWAQKFLETPWDQLMKEWNSQAVFKDSLSEPQRLESHYERPALAQALTEWSLAKQEDFRELIIQQSEKILWVSGDKDIKFASIAMELKKRAPVLQTETLAKASHRVMFDKPSELAQKMISFIQSECF